MSDERKESIVALRKMIADHDTEAAVKLDAIRLLIEVCGRDF